MQVFLPPRASPAAAASTVLTLLNNDPSSKVRLAAASTLAALLDRSKVFLLAAGDTAAASKAFTPLSHKLKALVMYIHQTLMNTLGRFALSVTLLLFVVVVRVVRVVVCCCVFFLTLLLPHIAFCLRLLPLPLPPLPAGRERNTSVLVAIMRCCRYVCLLCVCCLQQLTRLTIPPYAF